MEANGYDLTPMIGNLAALDMTLLEPPGKRIGPPLPARSLRAQQMPFSLAIRAIFRS